MEGPCGSFVCAPADPPPHRVLFTDATQGGVLGGSLTGVLELIAHLDRRRFEPSLVLFEPKSFAADLRAQGLDVHILPSPRRPAPVSGRSRPRRAVARILDLWRVVGFRARKLVQLFGEERPALIYCSNGVTPSLSAVVAGALCGIPVICHLKGFTHPGLGAPFMSRWVHTAICMTDEVAENARAHGIRAQRFVTIFDGIDHTASVPGAGATVRREFGIPPEAPVVGIVGHIQQWKGQILAVEAVARARHQFPALRCLVVGGVHRAGAAYAEKLRERIDALDLKDHVILTGARRDVLACMDAMDIVLHTSDREPFGRVLIEAMTVGRPVIAPREGGPRVIVVDGKTGLLVPPRDPDALSAAIVELFTDPSRRVAMGTAARARVEAVFGIRQHVRAIEGIFDEILGARAATAAAA